MEKKNVFPKENLYNMKDIEILFKLEKYSFILNSPNTTLKQLCSFTIAKNDLKYQNFPKELNLLIENSKRMYISRGIYFVSLLNDFKKMSKRDFYLKINSPSNEMVGQSNMSDKYFHGDGIECSSFSPSEFLMKIFHLFDQNKEVLSYYEKHFEKHFKEHKSYFYSYALGVDNPVESLKYSKKYYEEYISKLDLNRNDKNLIKWNLLIQNFKYFRLTGKINEAIQLIDELVELIPETHPYGKFFFFLFYYFVIFFLFLLYLKKEWQQLQIFTVI